MSDYPCQPHSDTSHAAARAARSLGPTLRDRVCAFIATRGAYGATDEEVQRALEIPGNTQRPRRRELQQRGLIAEARFCRPTSSGRVAVVWVAVGPSIQGDLFDGQQINT